MIWHWKSVATIAALSLLQLIVVLTQDVRQERDVILLLIGLFAPVILLLLSLVLSPNNNLWQLVANMSWMRKAAVTMVLLALFAVASAKGAAISAIGMVVLILSFLLFMFAFQMRMHDVLLRPLVATIARKLGLRSPRE